MFGREPSTSATPSVSAGSAPAGVRWPAASASAYLLALASVGLAFALRLHLLGEANVWYDEGMSLWVARQDLLSAARFTATDTHPPLYFWLLHYWLRLAGDSEFAARFPSVAAGVLTVAVVCQLGRSIAGPQVGGLAAAFVALSRFDLWWSQEVRMYSMAALVATAALWLFVRWWRQGGALWPYVLLVTTGLYTLYLTVVVIIATNLLVLVGRRPWDRRVLRPWLAAQAAILALFAPWLYLALTRMHSWSAATPTSIGTFITVYWTVLLLGLTANVEQYQPYVLPAALAILGLAGWIIWRPRKIWRPGLALLLTVLLLPMALVYLLMLPRALYYAPPLSARYFLLAQPALAVLLAAVVSRLGRRHWPLAAAVGGAVIVASVWTLPDYYDARSRQDSYDTLVKAIALHSCPGEVVLLHNDLDWPDFAYYYARYGLTLPIERIPAGAKMDEGQAEHYLAPIWGRATGIWVLLNKEASGNDPRHTVQAWLESRAVAKAQLAGEGKRLLYYGKDATPNLQVAPTSQVRADHRLSAEEADALGLLGYDQPVHRLWAGSPLPLTFYWGGREEPRLLRLLVGDPAQPQAVLATIDLPPGPATPDVVAVQRLSPRLPANLPAGRQALWLEVTGIGLQRLALGEIEVRQRSAPPNVTNAGTPLSVRFEQGIELIGYQAEPALTDGLRPGASLKLTLFWRATQPVEGSYTVFTHLLGEQTNPATGNPVWAQHDGEPQSGQRPTSSWVEGEVVADEHVLPLAADAPPGPYLLEVGLYDATTSARLSRLDEAGQPVEDRLVLGTVSVLAVR